VFEKNKKKRVKWERHWKEIEKSESYNLAMA